MKYSSKDTTCLMPWRGISIRQDSTVSPCCVSLYPQTPPNLNQMSVSESMNHEFFKDIRRHVIAGTVHPNCEKCIEKVRANVSNYPGSIAMYYDADEIDQIIENTETDGTINQIEISHADITTSNICNLTCRICGPGASTLWNAALKKVNRHENVDIIATSKANDLIDELSTYISDEGVVYFKGGEPLLMSEHFRFLDRLITENRTNLILKYVTNGTVTKFKGVSISEYWKHFKTIEISISIDGFGTTGEYMRQGLNWDKWLTSVKTFFEMSNVRVCFTVSVSNMNIWHIPDMIKSFIGEGLITNTNDRSQPYMTINAMTGDYETLRIQAIPESTKALIEEKYKEFDTWLRNNTTFDEYEISSYYALVDLMNSSNDYDVMKDQIHNRITDMDQLFGTSFYSVQSEYAPLLLK